MDDKANDKKPIREGTHEHIDHICVDAESHEKDDSHLEALGSPRSPQVKVSWLTLEDDNR